MTGILWAVVQSPITLQPLYPNGQAHHVTLQYGVEREAWADVIGLPMTVGAIAHCYNDRVQAIAVALPTWARCQNPHPHITVSWAEGATPVESNAMLNGSHESVGVSYEIHTIIEFQEWGELDPTVCKKCQKVKLRGVKSLELGLCSRCRDNKRAKAKYRK